MAFFLPAILSVPCIVVAANYSAQEAKGRQLYFHGTFGNGNGPMAFIGPESTPIPASVVPCAGCHGDDGLGRVEGGVVPPVVTWQYLTKFYGHTHPNGRTHRAFTGKSLAVAIQKGIDPAGNRLDSSMPRYELSKAQLAALIAYLKRIQTDQAPGVSEDTVHVGVILPLNGPLADAGEEMKAVLAAYFNEINNHGGIYNRKIQLQLIDSSESPGITLANINDLINNRQIFAIIATSMSWVENELPALAEREQLPVLGAMNLYAEDGQNPNRYSFYLFSGIKELMRTLIDYARENLKLINPKAAIVYPESGALSDTLAAIDRQSEIHRWPPAMRMAFAPSRFDASAIVHGLKEQGADVVYFLGGGAELKELLATADTLDRLPYILIPGSSIQSNMFVASKELQSRIFLAFPTAPSDWSPEGIAAFNTLQMKNGFSARHMATLVMVYGSARLFEQGLKLAGRQVSRGKFIASLEGLYDFETGLTPKLSYGPNRHTGALGAYVVTIDPKNKRFRVLSDRLIPKDYNPSIN